MILGVIQARMGSRRLPGKVLKPLGKLGMPSIWYVYKRMMNSGLIDKVIVATTTTKQDGPIRAFCKLMSITYLAGDEHNLMNRMRSVIHTFKPELVVDVTGDCPFVDPKHIATCIRMLKIHQQGDYCSNIYTRSWPDGFDVQVYKAKSFLRLSMLKEIDPKGAVPEPGHKHPAYNQGIVTEHTGWNFLNNPTLFELVTMGSAPKKYCYPKWKLTLDTPQDYEAIDVIFKGMAYKRDRSTFITSEQIIDFILANPEIKTIIRKGDELWKT